MKKLKKVKYKKYISYERERKEGNNHDTKVEGTGCFEKEFDNDGYFHEWGVDGDEGVTFTVAIIENMDGTCSTVLPENLKFI